MEVLFALWESLQEAVYRCLAHGGCWKGTSFELYSLRIEARDAKKSTSNKKYAKVVGKKKDLPASEKIEASYVLVVLYTRHALGQLTLSFHDNFANCVKVRGKEGQRSDLSSATSAGP
jgi:hypothetical protein